MSSKIKLPSAATVKGISLEILKEIGIIMLSTLVTAGKFLFSAVIVFIIFFQSLLLVIQLQDKTIEELHLERIESANLFSLWFLLSCLMMLFIFRRNKRISIHRLNSPEEMATLAPPKSSSALSVHEIYLGRKMTEEEAQAIYESPISTNQFFILQHEAAHAVVARETGFFPWKINIDLDNNSYVASKANVFGDNGPQQYIRQAIMGYSGYLAQDSYRIYGGALGDYANANGLLELYGSHFPTCDVSQLRVDTLEVTKEIIAANRDRIDTLAQYLAHHHRLEDPAEIKELIGEPRGTIVVENHRPVYRRGQE